MGGGGHFPPTQQVLLGGRGTCFVAKPKSDCWGGFSDYLLSGVSNSARPRSTFLHLIFIHLFSFPAAIPSPAFHRPLGVALDVVARRPVPLVGPYTGVAMTRTPFNEQIINVRAGGDRAGGRLSALRGSDPGSGLGAGVRGSGSSDRDRPGSPTGPQSRLASPGGGVHPLRPARPLPQHGGRAHGAGRLPRGDLAASPRRVPEQPKHVWQREQGAPSLAGGTLPCG